METQKAPNSQSILRKKNGAEESTFLNSDYTTKHQGSHQDCILQSSRQYGTGT